MEQQYFGYELTWCVETMPPETYAFLVQWAVSSESSHWLKIFPQHDAPHKIIFGIEIAGTIDPNELAARAQEALTNLLDLEYLWLSTRKVLPKITPHDVNTIKDALAAEAARTGLEILTEHL